MAEQPAQPGREPEAGAGAPAKGGIPWRLVALGALAVYGLLLVILNAKQVNVSFVFFSTRASLVVVLVVALGIGFLAGFLFDAARDRRNRARGSTS